MLKSLARLSFVLSLALLGACRLTNESTPPPATSPAQSEPTPTSTPAPTATLTPAEPAATVASPTAVTSEIDEAAEETAEETAVPVAGESDEVVEETAVAAPTHQSRLPAPTLFDTGWDERDVFRAGLIDSEQTVLAQLPGATVYHMALEIEDNISTVNGRQEIRYTNQEESPLSEIYFHLYPNLLGGSITIANLHVNGEPATLLFESANDSLMRIPLNAPLQPGEQIVLQMDFTTSAPLESGRNYGVFAYLDNILALAHFYPIIAVYDAEGWDIELPAMQGDVTYADSSFYLVRITAPAAQTIVAGGVEIGRETSGNTQTLTLAAGPMRDFYVAVSDRYTMVSHTVGQTQINSYAPTEQQAGAEAALDFAATALQSCSARFGIYPFTELDIVTTSTQALGIEYPGIIVNTLRIYDLDENTLGLPNSTLLESTTAHEVGHQWFYSLIGNDQLEEPWLDESLTQYVTYLYFLDTHGEPGAQGFYQSLQGRWDRIDGADIPIGLPVSAYEGNEYSAIVYGRGPIFVQELADTLGQETFNTFLREYAMTYRWDIVTTSAFKQMAESHCDCDLTALFEEWVFED